VRSRPRPRAAVCLSSGAAPGAVRRTCPRRPPDVYGIPHISTGDIFRANVQQETPLGREAQAYMDRGDLVPDDVVNRMVFDRLEQDDAAGGYLLDGYPRTVPLAVELDGFLAGRGEGLDAVLRFAVPEEELIARLLGRAEQEGRADDTEEVIRNRLRVYEDQTRPLESFYEERRLLHDVEAVGEIEEITERALGVLADLGHPAPARVDAARGDDE
jgi:adenylate kinase